MLFQVASRTLLSAPNGNVEQDDDDEEDEYVDVPYTYEVEEIQEQETTKDEIVKKSIPRLRALYAYKGNGMEMQKGEVCSTKIFLLHCLALCTRWRVWGFKVEISGPLNCLKSVSSVASRQHLRSASRGLFVVSAVMVGGLFLWPALRYGTGYQTF